MGIKEKVRALRARAKLSQGALARKAGVARNALSGIETGVTDPRASTIDAIAEALGIPPSVLMDDGISEDEALRIYGQRQGRAPIAVADRPLSVETSVSPRRAPILASDDLASWDWRDFTKLTQISSSAEFTASEDPLAFYLKARGPELTGPLIPDDGLLLIEPRTPIESGKYVLCWAGFPAVRKYVVTQDGPQLRSLHDMQTPIQFRRGMALFLVRSLTMEM